MKLLIHWILTFFLLASTVQAFTFTQEKSSPEGVCPRDTTLFISHIKNDAKDPVEITFTNHGTASSWATTVPTGLLLAPEEQKSIYTYTTPTLNTLPGNYNLDLLASSSNEVKTLPLTLSVKDCFNAALTTEENKKAVCPAEITKFEFKLQNTGAYREDYILRVQGSLKDKVSLSEDILSLASGENKKLFAYLTSPKESGEYGFTLIAQGSSGRSIQSINQAVEVRPCYAFKIDINKNTLTFCERTVNQLLLEVENDGTTTNTYNLHIDGPSWASLETDQLTLLPDTRKTVKIIFTPNFGIEGDFISKISVTPQQGETKALTEVHTHITKCHAVHLDLLENNVRVCTNGKEKTYHSLVTNKGTLEKQYTFTLQSPSWITADLSQHFTLQAGEQRNISLLIHPNENVKPGSYDIHLKVNATDESAVTVSDSAVFTVETVDTATCYKPHLTIPYPNLVIYTDSSIVFPVTVQNTGFEKAQYELLLGGSAASFSKLTPAALTLEPGRAETAYIYIAPGSQTRLNTYSLTTTIKLKDNTVLDTQEISLRLTNIKEEATPLEKISTNSPQETISLWNKIKLWFNHAFTPAQETQINNNSELNTTQKFSGHVQKNETLQNSSEKKESVETLTTSTTPFSLSTFITNYRYRILSLIILILVLIILLRIDAHKIFSDEDDDEE